jgi:periplasmic divalent cation tolerance protein
MTDTIQVITTTETKADAQAIARTVVEKRLAGCVQIIGPITSTYRWQGEIETAEEWMCVIKSRRDLYKALEEAIREVHPYDVPEILAVPVVAGSKSYLDWLDGELKQPSSAKQAPSGPQSASLAGEADALQTRDGDCGPL